MTRDGTIDWLCWPAFDSPACFAALLGSAANGYWRVAPVEAFTTRRLYRGGSLVLESVFGTSSGEVALIDFMAAGVILRIVEGRRGRVAVRMQAAPRFGYGRAEAPADSAALVFGSVKLTGAGGDVSAEVMLSAGERAWFAWGDAAPVDPMGLLAGALAEAEQDRSVAVLRALCVRGTGAMVAAPTTSLPAWPGGGRNWDYRFGWLRDSALAAQALLRAGRREEVVAWREWLRRCVDPGDPRALYGISAESDLTERVLEWLPGHAGARPVRVGNAAAGQLQIDAVGVLLMALAAAREAGLEDAPGQWGFECALVEYLEGIWALPDEGIWEVRGGRRHFTHSKAMAWAGFDRAIGCAERFGLEAPSERWRAARAQVHALVCAEGFDAAQGSFTQSFGRPELDASLLLLSDIGFLPPDDARMRGTVDAVARGLMQDGFVLRYRTEAGVDGVAGREGAFLPCSFWLADAWAREGRMAEARALFERLCRLRNDVGLLSEEVDPSSGALLGNFPQAFSHIALLHTAGLLAGGGR